MKESAKDPVISQVFIEQDQSHPSRQKLFKDAEELLGRPLISFFTSLSYPVSIEDTDVEMLEGILQKMDLSAGLALFISSLGGSGLAAERLINTCRSYSDTGEYWAIVPGKAKSAATLICFGASRICMGASSELGPVDPQYTVKEDGRIKRFSVFNLVESYKELFKGATNTKGRLEPYLQQLQRYDARQIKEMDQELKLSEDLAVKSLKTGMLKKSAEKMIKEKISIFLSPQKTKVHGRPIYRDEAKTCGLEIEYIDIKSKLWQIMYELYIRTNNFFQNKASKCIESSEKSFFANPPN